MSGLLLLLALFLAFAILAFSAWGTIQAAVRLFGWVSDRSLEEDPDPDAPPKEPFWPR